MLEKLTSTDIRKNLSLSLLIIGSAFAFPLALSGYNHQPQFYSFDTLNLYAMTAYFGYAHFFSAFQGQFKAISKHSIKLKWLLVIIILYGTFLGAFYFIGYKIFSFIAWMFFIPHFLKAEKIFTSNKEENKLSLPFTSLSFIILTYALFGYSYLPKHHTITIFILTGILLFFFLQKKLFKSTGSSFDNYIILGFFFLGEALLWASYNPNMSEYFRYGVYTVHIAAASFYHYFQSYKFAVLQTINKKPIIWNFIKINLFITTILIVITYLIKSNMFNPINIFTANVATHLLSSELFKYFREGTKKAAKN